MRYRSWLIYVSQYTKNLLHGLSTGVDRVRWLFYFKVQLRVNAVVCDYHVGTSMNQDQVSCKGTDLGLREPGSRTDRCNKGPQVFSCAAKPSESSMLSLLWRLPTRVSSNGKLPDWRDFEENGCASSLTFTRFVLAGS
jgi:hypothetical protein